MSISRYDRPVLPRLFAVGSYALVGGMILLLSHTAYRARVESGHIPADEAERIADELERLREEAPSRHSESFDRFVTTYLQDPRVLYCPEVDPHRAADYWPETAHPEDDMAYIYVSGLSTKVRGQWVLAYDERWNHLERGANVLHVGGQVEWTDDLDEVERAVAKQLGSRRLKGQKAGVSVPWWSRAPDRPAFQTAQADDERSSAWPVVVGALALGAGVIAFARLAKSSWSAVQSAGSSGHGRPRRPPGRRDLTS